ncbi:AAA family ATPase [Cystobacter fuscus]
MQITQLHIENFKGIAQLDISFFEEGTTRPRPLTMLLGDNGAGKTTVLQSIALVMSLATRRTTEPAELDWPGFIASRVSSQGPTRVEMGVRFESEELSVTHQLFEHWAKATWPEVHFQQTPLATSLM